MSKCLNLVASGLGFRGPHFMLRIQSWGSGTPNTLKDEPGRKQVVEGTHGVGLSIFTAFFPRILVYRLRAARHNMPQPVAYRLPHAKKKELLVASRASATFGDRTVPAHRDWSTHQPSPLLVVFGARCGASSF